MRRPGAVLLAAAILAAPVLAVAPAPVQGQDPPDRRTPDATLLLIGAGPEGPGHAWRRGVLLYHGQRHGLRVDGLGVTAVAPGAVTATGNVFGLHRLSDIEGSYTELGAGTARFGGGLLLLGNPNGVVIEITALSAEVPLVLAPTGLHVSLADDAGTD
jgi:hypothetical protein